MKLTGDRRKTILSNLYYGLIISLILMILVFIGGTIYGLFFSTHTPENNSHNNSQTSGEGQIFTGEGQIFTGIGRIRVPTKDPQQGMVIIFVSFVYYPEDKPFSEELALRVVDFRNIITEYIGSFPIAELHQLSEEHLKIELLRKLNAILRLGQIESLYFNDYMIVG